VSIVITNHDYEQFLPAAIDSALDQQRDADVLGFVQHPRVEREPAQLPIEIQ
jgi:hypothetical protein